MATVFWDSHGVILIDYLQKGKTITGAYYALLFDKLKAELAEKCPHLQKKKILFHQDNAPSHTTTPYSPDLAPSDFFLFPQLKIALGGQRFSSKEEAITFVNNYFEEKIFRPS